MTTIDGRDAVVVTIGREHFASEIAAGWPLDRVVVTLRHDRIHASDCEACETRVAPVGDPDRDPPGDGRWLRGLSTARRRPPRGRRSRCADHAATHGSRGRLGEGTTIAIELVVSIAHSGRLSIIVAGEEDATRQHLHTIVRRTLGARVREAFDGWEVMSLLLMPGNQVDLVISELRVLRGSGLDALIPMRAAGVGVPFLLLGGPARPAVHATAARLGALLLDEPVEVSDLLAGVRQLCGSGRPRGPGRRGGYTAC